MTRRLRALLPLLAAVLLATALPAVSAPTAAPRPTGPWPTWRVPVGGVMRDAVLERGEWVYTNTLWLALGANADGLTREQYFAEFAPDDPMRMSGDLRRAMTYEFFGMGRSVTNGDFELPTDKARWPDGTGEVAELRMTADADELFVRVLWNSYPSSTSQVAVLTFANRAPRSVKPWPTGGLSTEYATALTIAGGGASVLGDTQSHRPVISRDGDHVTEVRVPLRDLPSGAWTLVGGSGLARPDDPTRLWDPALATATESEPGTGGALGGQSGVMSVFFAREEKWEFDERRQAEIAGGPFATGPRAVVDPRDLQARRTKRAPVRTGDLSRIYRSRHDFGDGITREAGAIPLPAVPHGAPIGEDFNLTYTRTGRLQEYAMRVPAAYDGRKPWPLIVYLHGFGGTPEEPFRLPLGLVDEAEKRGYLFASLQGRGDTFYRPGLGELDVMEALADVRKHYRVDADRIYLMGHSMGGYGTNNIVTRHPELFAAVAPMQGTDSIDLAANLAHVPWLMITSDQDLDAGGAEAKRMYDALSALGYDATLLHYRFKIHEYSSIYDSLPRIFDHFATHRRVANPSAVTWVRPPSDDDYPELGQVHDGAYWLDGIDAGIVTVSSGALGGGPADPATAERVDADPVDEGGPSMRTMAKLRTTRPAGGSISRIENALTVTARGTSRLTVDVRRARLSLAGLTIRADVDAPVRLTLRDGTRTTTVTLEPGPRTVRLG